MINWLHPGLLLIFGALLVPFLKGRVKQGYLVLLPSAAFVNLVLTAPGRYGVVHFLGQELVFGRVDRLSLIFGYVFTLMAAIGMVYALHVKEDRQHLAALVYVGASLGVVFAGDYFSLFIFWEMMAFSSVFLIWSQKWKEAAGAGFRYILVHTFGGVALLGGIVLIAVTQGSITFGPNHASGLAFWLILIGFILNAAVPPLHAWLADAYPEATVTGAVFLCAFTTKTAVYVLVRAFSGTEILIYLGVAMALYGVIYAVLENDIRRLLAYHIISQVGYMVAGVGIGTEMAQNGSVAHAFSHILYKALLFMGAGAVIYATGRRKLTELGGLYKTMPITLTLYMIGGFSISAFPLFSGFVSKSMVVAAGAEQHLPGVVLLLTLASSGTFLHTGLKLPYYIFFGKDAGIQAKEPPLNMLIGMGLAAFLCIAIGLFPDLLYRYLPYPVHFHPYTGDHVVGALSILLFTALGFFLLLKQLDPEPTISLDTDWFYRIGGRKFLWLADHPIAAYEGFVSEMYRTMVIRPMKRVVLLCRRFDVEVIDGAVNAVGRGVFGGGWLSNVFENYIIYGFINLLGYANHVGARIFRRLQTGSVHNYAMIIIIGFFILVNIYILFKDRFPSFMLVVK
ncbi:MAG TPA: Na(+)/H(+) antiporter subunit D [Candidatus Manganitrophaceae bacterium]|nr:Na(+)/H(+) antiporter subunit D [Candidatus Manganitrophaceae bacterium]